ncbi:MAG: hypothetical protein ACR2LF_09695 [Jatrophihabitantaceae bacterium]
MFINCVAQPLGPARRARLLGSIIGSAAANLDRRVLFLGSGGLSHGPPVLTLKVATREDGIANGFGSGPVFSCITNAGFMTNTSTNSACRSSKPLQASIVYLGDRRRTRSAALPCRRD